MVQLARLQEDYAASGGRSHTVYETANQGNGHIDKSTRVLGTPHLRQVYCCSKCTNALGQKATGRQTSTSCESKKKAASDLLLLQKSQLSELI